jgi:polar amino acid transport system permease protein
MIDLEFAARCLPVLLQGLWVTLLATLLGMTLALVGGLFWAALRSSTSRVLRGGARAAVELVRSTPLLVQLYFLFYVLPSTGIRFSPLTTGVLGLGLHYSAYLAEVYRAGIDAVPRGQWEAASVLGLPRARAFISIILPQAWPPMLPVMGNYLIAMFKDTPLLSAITVLELLQRAKLLGAAEFRYLEPLTLAGLLLLAISVSASRVLAQLERRHDPA